MVPISLRRYVDAIGLPQVIFEVCMILIDYQPICCYLWAAISLSVFTFRNVCISLVVKIYVLMRIVVMINGSGHLVLHRVSLKAASVAVTLLQ